MNSPIAGEFLSRRNTLRIFTVIYRQTAARIDLAQVAFNRSFHAGRAKNCWINASTAFGCSCCTQ